MNFICTWNTWIIGWKWSVLAQVYEDKRFLIPNHKQAREPSETWRTPRTSSEPAISLAPCFTHFYWFIASDFALLFSQPILRGALRLRHEETGYSMLLNSPTDHEAKRSSSGNSRRHGLDFYNGSFPCRVQLFDLLRECKSDTSR